MQIAKPDGSYAGLDEGKDDRNSAFIMSCDRWSEQDVYIVLPINPTSFEVSNPIRGTQGETQRGKFMYVHRNPLSKSVIAPCNYSFEIPSGLILPQFSEAYIREAEALARERVENAISETFLDPDTRTASAVSYGARVANYTGMVPGPTQTRDYRTASPYYRAPTRQQSATSNIPALYAPNVPIAIQNFYAFIMLADEPRRFVDKRGVLRNNRIIINFNTLTLPNMTFYGWWDQAGITYTEDVESHVEFNINFNIFVTGSTPSFGYNHFHDMMNTYKAMINTQVSSLDILRSTLST
jgi:hypothetical protein